MRTATVLFGCMATLVFALALPAAASAVGRFYEVKSSKTLTGSVGLEAHAVVGFNTALGTGFSGCQVRAGLTTSVEGVEASALAGSYGPGNGCEGFGFVFGGCEVAEAAATAESWSADLLEESITVTEATIELVTDEECAGEGVELTFAEATLVPVLNELGGIVEYEVIGSGIANLLELEFAAEASGGVGVLGEAKGSFGLE